MVDAYQELGNHFKPLPYDLWKKGQTLIKSQTPVIEIVPLEIKLLYLFPLHFISLAKAYNIGIIKDRKIIGF